MKKLFTSFLVAILIYFINMGMASAQSSTHAHSSSRLWKGLDVDSILNNGAIGFENATPIFLYNVGTGRFVIEGGDWGMEARLFHDDFGRKMFLFKESNGVLKIEGDVSEENALKTRVTLNIPLVTRQEPWWGTSTRCSVTTIMDGYDYWGKWNFVRIPSEVASGTTEHYTYYMYQQHDSGQAFSRINTTPNPNREYQGVSVKNIMFRYGAAYGEYCSDGTMTFYDYDKDKNKPAPETVVGYNTKGCGYYVHVDDDRSCWTTAGNANNSEASPWGNQTLVEVNGDSVTIDELYQWRVISEEEFIEVLNGEIIGINPSISSLVYDRDFTRNSDEFFPYWHTTAVNDTVSEVGEGRYGYTWGNVLKATNQYYDTKDNSSLKARYPYRYKETESWDKPLKLKKVFASLKEAKFGFMSFEGIGTVWTTVQVPNPGWYQVEACGVNFSTDNTHRGHMFTKAGYVTDSEVATLKGLPNSSYLGYGRVEFEQKSNVPALSNDYTDIGSGYQWKRTEGANLIVGKALTYHSEDFRKMVWVYIDPVKFAESTDNQMLTIGFEKTAGIKTLRNTSEIAAEGDNTAYYYDDDWLCVDDIRVSYMGLAPAFFYEEEENLDYLVYNGDFNARPSAVPDGMYSGATSLEREFNNNEWNSFSFPIPLSGEQIRLAFGEDSELLKLDQVLLNEYGYPFWINFNTVDLKAAVTKDPNTGKPIVPIAVEPGKFYLLKPTQDPVEGIDPMGRNTEYYELGRNYFAVDPTQVPVDYSHTVIDTDHPYASYAIASPNHSNDGTAYVSYVRTRGMYTNDNNGKGTKKDPSLFIDSTTGLYNYSGADAIDPTTEFLFVPKNGFALSKKDGKQGFVKVNKDTPLKGFRAWLTMALYDDIFERQGVSQVKMAINGFFDDDEPVVTSIDGMEVNPSRIVDGTAIYDLCGRKTGTVGTTELPRGLYIVAGKKVLVK